jgi:hypothetical protein
MRRFSLGSMTDRRVVVIELDGARMSVIQHKLDGSTKRTERELGSEAEARSASEQVALELVSRGYVEHLDRTSKPDSPDSPVARPVASSRQRDDDNPVYLLEEPEEPAAYLAPVTLRVAPAPSMEPETETEPKKKKKKGGKKKKREAENDALDKRVLAGLVGVGALIVGLLGFVVYDAFIKPPSIVGTWRGSMIEFEIGHPIIHTQYDLILDEQKRASMTLQEKYTSIGTYSVKGKRLTLTFKDDDGESSERVYKISLGRSTLDLMDPETGKLQVQLIRFLEKPVVEGKKTPLGVPKDLATGDVNKIDEDADARLASVEYRPKDNAFKLRHPQGWRPDTGSRPDNTYSWATFSQDSAKISVHADIKGSLMSGSDSAREHEEGSETAPVHIAHELYKKTAAEEFADFNESTPVVFKGAPLGEGRISLFTASGEGLFGSKLRGYHVTLLTKDRRVTILCYSPEKEFANLKPTFLAVCRSLSY